MIEIETVKSPSPQPVVEAAVTPVKKERAKVQRSAAPKVKEEPVVKKEKAKYEKNIPLPLLIFPKTHLCRESEVPYISSPT